MAMAHLNDTSSFDNPNNIRQEALLLVAKFSKFHLGTFLSVITFGEDSLFKQL
jgi:hypothetical protein